jgi:hypothetical protein
MRQSRERTHDDEKDGQGYESHKLNGFPSPPVNEKERCPVPGNQAGDRKDQVSDTNVPQTEICVTTSYRFASTDCVAAETNGLQNDTRVETEPVESNLCVKCLNAK